MRLVVLITWNNRNSFYFGWRQTTRQPLDSPPGSAGRPRSASAGATVPTSCVRFGAMRASLGVLAYHSCRLAGRRSDSEQANEENELFPNGPTRIVANFKRFQQTRCALPCPLIRRLSLSACFDPSKAYGEEYMRAVGMTTYLSIGST